MEMPIDKCMPTAFRNLLCITQFSQDNHFDINNFVTETELLKLLPLRFFAGHAGIKDSVMHYLQTAVIKKSEQKEVKTVDVVVQSTTQPPLQMSVSPKDMPGLFQLVKHMITTPDLSVPDASQDMWTFVNAWKVFDLEAKEEFIIDFSKLVSFELPQWPTRYELPIKYNTLQEGQSVYLAFHEMRQLYESLLKELGSAKRTDGRSKTADEKKKDSKKKDYILKTVLKPQGKEFGFKWKVLVLESIDGALRNSKNLIFEFVLQPASDTAPTLMAIMQQP